MPVDPSVARVIGVDHGTLAGHRALRSPSGHVDGAPRRPRAIPRRAAA